MFGRLRLGTRFVRGNQKDRTVQKRGGGDDGRHQRFVSGCIDEGYFPFGHSRLLTGRAFFREGMPVTFFAMVDLGIGITDANRDAPLDFLAMGIGPFSCNRMGEGCFSMVDMTQYSDVHFSLHAVHLLFFFLGLFFRFAQQLIQRC